MSESEINMSAEDPVAEETQTDPVSELDLPMWAVVCFNRRIAGGLTYADAVAALEKEKGSKSSGLCIVTDEAALRIKSRGKSIL